MESLVWTEERLCSPLLLCRTGNGDGGCVERQKEKSIGAKMKQSRKSLTVLELHIYKGGISKFWVF